MPSDTVVGKELPIYEPCTANHAGAVHAAQSPSGVMGGKACIRGMRVTVGMIVGQIGAGHSIEEVLSDYPYLEREDILQALRRVACGRTGNYAGERMKLLVDMNLSPRWVSLLADSIRHPSEH
ncbi:DUF433 domain-containing protein [Methylocaldum gracile]|uniref:DUF433 domain-containing protein n=1 Tax=Methylocaldum sp. 0917 TaxID=2485163 RepID=UPI001B79D3A7